MQPAGQFFVLVTHAASSSHISADVIVSPTHIWGAPHSVPAGWLSALSTQVIAPVLHEVMPILQTVGLVAHEAPAVQATQLPPLLQTIFVPQAAPGAFCVSLAQTIVPVVQLVMPVKHGFGLVVQL